MASKVLSIEINKLVTKICEVDSGKNPKIYKCFSIDTPEGILVDDMVQSNTAYEEALRTAIAANGCTAKRVIFTITSAKIANREVEIPYVKESRVGEVVKAKAGEYFPVNLEDYKVAYSILGTVGEGSEKKRKVQILAVPLALLKGYYDLAGRCGWEIEAIDYMGNSLFQAVKGLCMSDTELVVKIDENSTVVMIIKNREMVSYRNIAYGVNEAIQALMNAKKGEGGMLSKGMEYEEAVEELRKNLYIHSIDPTRAGRDSVIAEVTNSLEYLVNNINRVIDFYNSRAEGNHIAKMHVTGLGGTFKGMAEFMQESIGVPATSIRNIDRLNFPRNFDRMYVGDYIGCLGAVLNPLDMKLDIAKDKSGKIVPKDHNGIYIIVCVLGIAVALGLLGMSYLSYNDAKSENDRLKEEIAKLSYTEGIHNAYLASQTIKTDVETMYEVTQNRNGELVEFLEEMETKMPSDFRIADMSGTAENITLHILTKSKAQAACIIKNLSEFESVAVVSVSPILDIPTDANDTFTESRSVEFTVICTYAEKVEEGNAEDATAEQK